MIPDSAPVPPRSSPPLWATVRLGGLGLVVWLVAARARPGLSGSHLVALALLCGAAVASLCWLAASLGGRRGAEAVSVAGIGAAGGALAAFGPAAIAFVGVAGLGAGIAVELPGALVLAAVGPAALAVTAELDGRPAGLILEASLVALAGLVVGVSRRQRELRINQIALLAVERQRAAVERSRADALAERNRVAREIHDVLAHTLGALAVRLEALDSVVVDGGGSPTIRDGLRSTRRLVSEGLEETRQAVRALRESAPPLPQRLAALTDAADATVAVSGQVRGLPPEAAQALYRAAQEALTNARKHAPGAAVTVELAFCEKAVTLTVTNQTAELTSMPAAAGGGFGLQGMRERALLLQGHVDAGPIDNGWRVLFTLPA
ncbi:MAG TPA: histidine kinase [Verrucomicrobiae bacterium]|nr:histidine kinase [Verrucomicrobiae bacterium]